MDQQERGGEQRKAMGMDVKEAHFDIYRNVLDLFAAKDHDLNSRTVPENSQVTPAWGAGRLTADLHCSF